MRLPSRFRWARFAMTPAQFLDSGLLIFRWKGREVLCQIGESTLARLRDESVRSTAIRGALANSLLSQKLSSFCDQQDEQVGLNLGLKNFGFGGSFPQKLTYFASPLNIE